MTRKNIIRKRSRKGICGRAKREERDMGTDMACDYIVISKIEEY